MSATWLPAKRWIFSKPRTSGVSRSNEIKQVLENLGLTLGKTVEGWPPEEDIEMLRKRYSEFL